MHAFRFREPPQEPQPDLLLPERRQPVRRSLVGADVVDADFITVIDGPRRSFTERRCEAKGFHRRPEPAWATAPIEPRLTFAQLASHLLGSSSGRLFSGILAAICLAVFAAGGALSTLLAEPATAIASTHPLDIDHVTLTSHDANGMRVLGINAIVQNRSQSEQSVPPIRADLTLDGTVVGSVLVATPSGSIKPGQSRGMSARIPYAGGKLPKLKLFFDQTAAHSL
ncbi:hypothetical protein [Rhizobium halophytocola]|uniref:DUF3426 domain-containing protein n=1 Tax=Rhizobium halophytocola TaxID=735519 RepID=A0ABS4E2K7_9HYPH|nr:hypothetical protein [Rhizobium halophytocola]MBP1852173.1 hypothetical protein [Rhizobium halophytocola]